MGETLKGSPMINSEHTGGGSALTLQQVVRLHAVHSEELSNDQFFDAVQSALVAACAFVKSGVQPHNLRVNAFSPVTGEPIGLMCLALPAQPRHFLPDGEALVTFRIVGDDAMARSHFIRLVSHTIALINEGKTVTNVNSGNQGTVATIAIYPGREG